MYLLDGAWDVLGNVHTYLFHIDGCEWYPSYGIFSQFSTLDITNAKLLNAKLDMVLNEIGII